MIGYLRWSLWQLYLLFFWPSRFHREVEDVRQRHVSLSFRQRAIFMVKMLPWTVAFTVLSNLFAGKVSESFGGEYDWARCSLGVVLGVAMGVTMGVTFRVTLGIAVGLSAGASIGMTMAVLGDVSDRGMDVSRVMLAASLGLLMGFMIWVVSTYPGYGVQRVRDRFLGLFLAVYGVFGAPVFALFPYLQARDGNSAGVVVGTAILLGYWTACFHVVLYPFYCVFSAILYRVARSGPDFAPRLWKFHPLAWDELIWLPLPFAGRFLTLVVQQERVRGFPLLAFVAAERSLQRRVAREALAETCLEDLSASSLETLANASPRLNWTTDAPLDLPSPLPETLPRLQRIAQHVGQYLSLQNPYRRRQTLERASEEIQSLQRALTVSRDRLAPRILQKVNGWHALLDAEAAKWADSRAMRQIPNPFVFGNPVTSRDANVFTGRRDVARRIEECILGGAQAPTLLLYGPRRMGKTSILNQLPRLLGPDIASAVIDCQNPAATGTPAGLLAYWARNLGQALRERAVRVRPLDRQSLVGDAFAEFDDWLDRGLRSLPPTIRILLCWDEYEKLQQTLHAGWGVQLLDYLRHLLQHRPQIVPLFTGVRTFEQQGPDWTARFVNARRVRVGRLSRDEVLPLLTKPIPEFDLTYGPEALETLMDATAGQPFLTQATAYELVNWLNRHDRKEAIVEDVRQAIDLALDSGAEYFANIWHDAGDHGRAVLRSLVSNQPVQASPTVHQQLREQEILDTENHFLVPMVQTWIHRRCQDTGANLPT